MPVQIADVVVPSEFSAYVAENSLVTTAFFQSGVLVNNPLIEAQLAVGLTCPRFSQPFITGVSRFSFGGGPGLDPETGD